MTAALSAAHIARLRAVARGFMQDSCTILRSISVSDGAGGVAPRGPERIGPIACALAVRSGKEAADADRLRQIGAYALYLPYTTDIRATDQIEMASGKRYNIVFAPEAAWPNIARIVGAEEAP